MSLEVKIPAVGESITSGVISEWRKKSGDAVAAGEVLFLLETDKISTEITADKAGILTIKAEAGQEVKVGEVVATIEEGQAAAAQEPVKTGPSDDIPTTKIQSPALFRPGVQPAAVMQVATERSPASVEVTTRTASSQQANSDRESRKPMSPLRRKIAAQLVSAQQTAAILTTFNECDMTAIMALRKELQDDFTARHAIKLGFMSFFVKATVESLKRVPAVNGRIEGDDFIQNHYFDIGVAVSTERGLVVPVIRDADQKSFAEIEHDLAGFAVKAREGKITIDDLQGGVFTISNGGVFGSLLSTPILNPPQTGILGMHTIKDRPMAVNGAVAIRPMMYLALSYDHRAVDGRGAVSFLVTLKQCIEEPARLLVQA
jgi:2-oxoglutarate dehydrogenase E2 component (dihydrolipoamide succinyltransferase)